MQQQCDSELYDDIVSIKKYTNQNLTTESTDRNSSMSNISEAVSTKMKPKPQPKPRNSKVTIIRPKPPPKPRTLHAARKVKIAHKEKHKPLPKPRVAAQGSETVPYELYEHGSKSVTSTEKLITIKPQLLPKPTFAIVTQDDDIYDDVVVYRTKDSCEPPVAIEQLLHEDEEVLKQNPLASGAGFEQTEDLYTDASSHPYPRVSTTHEQKQLLHEEEEVLKQNPLASGAGFEQTEDLYTDASSHPYPRVSTTHEQKQLLHEEEEVLKQNPLASGAGFERTEDLYTDASSHPYPRVSTHEQKPELNINSPSYEQRQADDGSNASEEQSPQSYIYSQPHQDCRKRLSVDRARDNVPPATRDVQFDSPAPTENISTPRAYIYPSLGLRRSQQEKSLQYDYACQDIGLSLNSVTSASDSEQISSSDGVFTARNYDYAYQLQPSPNSKQVSDSEKGSLNPKYYYITNSSGFDIDSFDSNNQHSYDTICDARRPELEDPPVDLPVGNIEAEATASGHYQNIHQIKTEGQREINAFSIGSSSLNSEHTHVSVRMNFDPLPDVPQLQLSNSEEEYSDYEDIDPKPYEQPHFDNQLRQRTSQLVRGPNKKKLHLSLKHRKSTRRPSILDVGADQAQFSTQTPEDSCESDDDWDTVPFGKSRKVYDMLLEASGIHHGLSVTISPVRRHSVSSPESCTELLSISMAAEKRFLETVEFDRLVDVVYSKLKSYKDAGVSSRAKFAKELRELMEGAELSPPPLPGIIRPRSRLVSKTDQRLVHRFRRSGSM